MRFLAAGEDDIAEPSDSVLQSWFADNRDKFNIAERRSFNHIYFSPERHGEAPESAVGAALEKLKGGSN